MSNKNALIYSTAPLGSLFHGLDQFQTLAIPSDFKAGKKLRDLLEEMAIEHIGDFSGISMANMADYGATPQMMEQVLSLIKSRLPQDGVLSPANPIANPVAIQQLNEALVTRDARGWLNTRQGGWNARDWAILEQRVLPRNKEEQKKLQNLADEFGCTRENIRICQMDIQSFLKSLVGENEIVAFRNLINQTKQRIGSGLPFGHAEEELHQLSPEDPLAASCAAFVAGPYRKRQLTEKSTRYWLVREDVEFPDVAKFISSPNSRIIDGYALDAALLALGFTESAVALWRNEHPDLYSFNGRLVWNEGTRAERAIGILEASGKPMSKWDLLTQYKLMINDQTVNEISFWNALAEEKTRLVRTGANDWALVSWGLESYESIADCIVRVLNENGGACPFPQLREACAKRWGINENSLRSTSQTPCFITENGIVRVRQNYSEVTVPSDTSKRKGLFAWKDGSLSWRLQVSSETMRGSSVPLPKELTGWLHLPPGGKIPVQNSIENLEIHWPPTAINGAHISSILALCNQIGAKSDSWITLHFRRMGLGTLVLSVNSSDQATSMASKLGLPIDMPIEEVRSQLTEALKVSPGDELQALRDRGEADIAALLMHYSTIAASNMPKS